jgi:DNA-binding transcriptional ArsR family regulator
MYDITTLPPTGHKILDALKDDDLCERDLFIRLRPVDQLALHRLLREMDDDGLLASYGRGRLPGPVVTYYALHYDPFHAR